MKKRLQVILNDEAWAAVEALTNEANLDFDAGSISFSDAINEMVLSAKVDVKALQLKHTDFRRSLRSMAAKGDLDLDAVIKNLMELRAKATRKRTTMAPAEDA